MGYGEALTRSITAGLRCGVLVFEYTRQLNAIGKALEQYGLLTAEGMTKLIQDLNAQLSGLSEEDKRKEVMKSIDELRKERGKLELDNTYRP